MPELEKYVIVTDVTGAHGGTRPRGQVDFGIAAEATEKSGEAVVATADLSPVEARELEKVPGKIAAPVMETRLIDPVVQDGQGNWVAAQGLGDDVPVDAAAVTTSWGIGAVNAHISPATGAGVRVAVLDTGIDRNHPAFAGMTIVEQDFMGQGNGDVQGHGTHCAGTIFGRDCFNHRIGVARGVTHALIGKVLGNDGRGGTDALLQGMLWAIQSRADVISMSLGFDFPGFVARLIANGVPPALAASRGLVAYRQNLRAFDAVMGVARANVGLGAGPVVVAATGNESQVDVNPQFRIEASLPSAALDIIAVGAAQQAGAQFRIADFSNSMPVVVAPGVGIISAKSGGQLTSKNGTSMATPHVAGVAALWWQHLRGQFGQTASASQVAARLSALARANNFVAGFTRAEFGDGMVTSP